MPTIKYINRISRIDQFIRQKKTGSPKEFASKMGISESHLYTCLNELKDLGLHIEYSKYERTYYYDGTVRLKVQLAVENILTNECIVIAGRK
jgi:predicted DNA-binding transcriptional regulator YafY